MANEPDEAVSSADELRTQSSPVNNGSSKTFSEPNPDHSDGTNLRNVTIIVCSTCRKEDGSAEEPTPGRQLYEATVKANSADNSEGSGAGTSEARSSDGIKVISIECLGNCKRRLSAAVVTDQAWDYVFGDLTIENAGDLIEGARLMQGTTNGLMPWRGRPQCLKSGMVARIPPLGPPIQSPSIQSPAIKDE